jgi:hypothetical protein
LRRVTLADFQCAAQRRSFVIFASGLAPEPFAKGRTIKQFLQTAYREDVLQHASRITAGWGSSVFALTLICLVLGIFLARFNVFAALIATAICAVSTLIYVLITDPTPAYVLLTPLVPAFALQVGYLVGQFLWRRRKKDRLH